MIQAVVACVADDNATKKSSARHQSVAPDGTLIEIQVVTDTYQHLSVSQIFCRWSTSVVLILSEPTSMVSRVVLSCKTKEK